MCLLPTQWKFTSIGAAQSQSLQEIQVNLEMLNTASSTKITQKEPWDPHSQNFGIL